MFSKVNIKIILLTTICLLSKSARIGKDKDDFSKIVQALFGNNTQDIVPTATSTTSNCTCVPYYLCKADAVSGEFDVINIHDDHQCDDYLEVCCFPTNIIENPTVQNSTNTNDKLGESIPSIKNVTKADDCVCVAYYLCDVSGTDIVDLTDAKCESYLDVCCSPSNIKKQ